MVGPEEEPVPVSTGSKTSKSKNKEKKSSSEKKDKVASEYSLVFGAADFKVRKASAALERMVGPLPEGCPLLDVLGGNELKRTVQQSINELCYPTEDTPEQVTLPNVLLKQAKQAAGAGTWRVTCTLDFAGLDEDSVELDNLIVEAILTDIVQQDAGAAERKLVDGSGAE